ncbi:MAG: hypothetical protein WCE75_10930, partial [Terracidiphilus sp.]
MTRTRFFAALACTLLTLSAVAQPASPWAEPAAKLAAQVAEILGPAQARLVIRNQSSLPTGEIPAIRRLLEKGLKDHGVTASGAEAANTIRVTLSENQRERLWVAEIVEGNETRVAMVEAGQPHQQVLADSTLMLLRKERLPVMLSWSPEPAPDSPVLSVLSTNAGLAVLEPDGIRIYYLSLGGYLHGAPFPLGLRQPLARDARGLLVASADGSGFTAYIGGAECDGAHTPPAEPTANPKDAWQLHCHPSDDPWPILTADTTSGLGTIKAFNNAARNYFTG